MHIKGNTSAMSFNARVTHVSHRQNDPPRRGIIRPLPQRGRMRIPGLGTLTGRLLANFQSYKTFFRWPLSGKLLSALIVTAFCAGLISSLIAIWRGSIETSDTPGYYVFVPIGSGDSMVAGLLNLLAMTCLLTTGLVAFFQGAFLLLGLGRLLILGIYTMVALYWLATGFLSMRIPDLLLSSNSPIVWFLLFGVFAGTQPKVFRHLSSIAAAVAWLIFIPMLWSVASLQSYGRFRGQNPQVMYLAITLWFSIYHLLATPAQSGFLSNARSIPLLACFVVAIFNQGRGWAVICILGFFLYIIRPIIIRRMANPIQGVMGKLAFAGIGMVIACIVLQAFFPSAIEGLINRLDEDTRSEQYQIFFSQLDPWSLLPGKGPSAGYLYNGNSDYGYIDNQLLWMAWKGGSVILSGYALFVLAPGWRLMWRPRNEKEYAAACTLFLWSLAVGGVSTFLNINYNVQNFFVVLLAGYCLAASRQRKIAHSIMLADTGGRRFANLREIDRPDRSGKPSL